MPTTRYLSYHKRRRRRRRNFWLIILLILLLTAAGVLTWIAFSNLSREPQASSQLEESSAVSEPEESSLPADGLSVSNPQDSANEGLSSEAVSYTHLDVYKRQHLEDQVELKASFCLGHCTDGVATMINGELVDHVSPENAVEIFHKYVLEPLQK